MREVSLRKPQFIRREVAHTSAELDLYPNACFYEKLRILGIFLIWRGKVFYHIVCFDSFEEFVSYVENQTELKLKRIRTDNGSEYVNGKF